MTAGDLLDALRDCLDCQARDPYLCHTHAQMVAELDAERLRA